MRSWLQSKAGDLKGEITALWYALRDPRVGWTARVLGAVVLAYALSPIDLIPDFIPVIGYLDDLVLVPLGIWLVLKLVPEGVLEEHRAAVSRGAAKPPESHTAALVIIAVWVASIALAIKWLLW